MAQLNAKEGEVMSNYKSEKRHALPGELIIVTAPDSDENYGKDDVFVVSYIGEDGVVITADGELIGAYEYEVLPKESADLLHTNDGEDLLDQYMLTQDERDQYEADGRKLPAHYYIEGAHIVKGAVGKRKEPSYSAEELYSASAAERYGHLKAVEAGDGRLYNVKLYTANANYHVLRLDDETLARLESDLETDVAENFTQYYCHDAEAVVGVRLEAVELYTVKEAEG